MSYEQMKRDGISRLPKWGRGVRIGCATYRAKIDAVPCEHRGCSKRAGYKTPRGNRCFAHAREAASDE